MSDVEISKFLSWVLRHEPQAIGLTLDPEGWADLDVLVAAAAAYGQALDQATIDRVVETNDKKRFSISSDGLSIRAAQGHSTDQVAITYPPVPPPAVLFHGTATRFLESIRAEGLRPQSRHYVHLSATAETAMAVGRRHGAPVLLEVLSGAMHRAGMVFHRADNGVWLTRAVPAEFLSG